MKTKKIKLNIFWANNFWMRSKEGTIYASSPIPKRSKHRGKLLSPHLESSMDLLKIDEVNKKLRTEFQTQKVNSHIQDHHLCRSDAPICHLFFGGTASGKSSIADFLKEETEDGANSSLIDYDIVKKMIPEYPVMLNLGMKNAAEFVHVESTKIAARILKKSIKKKYNIIYETTLRDPTITLERIKEMKRRNYMIYAHYSHIDIDTALIRAKHRYKKTGRYVPEPEIIEIYKHVPCSIIRVRDAVDSISLWDNRGDNQVLFGYYSNGLTVPFNSKLLIEYNQAVGPEYSFPVSS